ncbi:MAG: hypothetical protein KDD40_10230, partial [Bdellovibrionales bacterium]|nr:hypothetical protein [Bdellovibrionales bacterium]
DREKSTRDKYAYKKSSLSPITSVAVSVSSEGLEKPLRGYRSPGKTVASETRTYDVKYKEGGESKSAKLKVVYRVMATDSKKSESTNLRYGRKVTGLIVEMASGTATVEESVVFNGEMDNDTYTKVNGKMLFQNGKLVEEERN